MSLKAAMETVLVVGSTGNIGTSAVSAALRSKRNVLALVRNQISAEKLVKNVGTSQGITFAHADVASKNGIKSVVEQVRAGKLPAFQHVWSSGRLRYTACSGPSHTLIYVVGGEYTDTKLQDITDEQLEYNMELGFQANFRKLFFAIHDSSTRTNIWLMQDLAGAYRDSIGYLLEQKNPASTWTICTGAQGELALYPMPAMTQGALFSMCIAASRENEKTNVRFNEILLAFRVEVDEVAKDHGVTTASEFGQVYESVLANTEIRSSRIRVEEVVDMKKLRYARRF